MSAFVDASNNVVNIEPSEVTHTASGSAGEVSNSDHSVYRSSESPSYESVSLRVLNIPTCLRDSNNLDKFLSKVSFSKPDSPSDTFVEKEL